MTKKTRRSWSPEQKAKIVLELLKETNTLNEVAKENEIHPKMLSDWKAEFLANAELAFDKGRGLRELKHELKERRKKEDELHRQIGQLTAEVNWAKKKSIEAGLACEEIFDNQN